MLATVCVRRRRCLAGGGLGSTAAVARRGLLVVRLLGVERLQAQLQLEDPLLLVVRSQLARVVRQLLRAVAFEHARKVSDLCFELLVRLLLLRQLVVAAWVRALRRRRLRSLAVPLPLPRRRLLFRIRLRVRARG